MPTDPTPTPPSSSNPIDRARQARCLPVVRTLARAYQAFSHYSDRHIRQLGLTPSQFDTIATLGNTTGLSMQELAQRTLVTKGTLTGIVDRLEAKGLVRREVPPHNRRSFTIVLTESGQTLFETVFPEHIQHLEEKFADLSDRDLAAIQTALTQLQSLF